MNCFYTRVSSEEQNDIRQIEKAHGLNVDKIFSDKASGKNTDRPQLQKMLDCLREGDTVTALSIDRLGRNTKDILDIVDRIKEKKAMFKCLSPEFDTSTPYGEFFLAIMASVAELERRQIKERQRQGIEMARKFGRYTGRKPKQLENFEGIYKQWADNKITAEQAGKLLNISRSTFYRRVNAYRDKLITDFNSEEDNFNPYQYVQSH